MYTYFLSGGITVKTLTIPEQVPQDTAHWMVGEIVIDLLAYPFFHISVGMMLL